MNTLPWATASPRLWVFIPALFGKRYLYCQRTRPVAASSANTWLREVTKYITPSMTSGVDCNPCT